MNMKFLEVVTPPPDIYNVSSTRNTFWEENFIPVNMTSCGRRNVRKNRETKNGEKYIILEISSKLDCLDNREVIYSESKDYMGIPGKGMTTYMYLRTKRTNKKQKARFSITDITNQDFRKLLNKFKN